MSNEIATLLRSCLSRLDDLSGRLEVVESRLDDLRDDLAEAQGRRRLDPDWISIKDAARLAGLSKVALQSRLRRERERCDGFQVRRRHGALHRADFLAYLESRQLGPGAGAQAREALKQMEAA